MELDQLEELSTKTNEELIEMSIELIKTLYKNKPKQGFRLESGTFVKDSEHYFKSYKSYLTKPNNIRSITTGELKEVLYFVEFKKAAEMRNYKVLNLYACLGGNRLLWEDCEVTAVELDPELARLYQERFPNDIVIIADAHQYLLDHYQEFDFIWSSPPCPTHSRARFWNSSNYNTTTEAIYPDMKLYEEILFLQHYYRTGKYVVENVIPYYDPLIPAKKRGRHLYWTNFNLPSDLQDRRFPISSAKNELKGLCEFHNYDFTKYNGNQSVLKIARNLVDFKAGETIYNTARNIIKESETNQMSIFEF